MCSPSTVVPFGILVDEAALIRNAGVVDQQVDARTVGGRAAIR
jgi:hypothetical protein